MVGALGRLVKLPAGDCPFSPEIPDGEISPRDFSIAIFHNRFSPFLKDLSEAAAPSLRNVNSEVVT